MLSFLWLLYPIAWGLADGSSYIHPDSEMIFYGILDVLAKPVFIFFHLFQLAKLDLTALQLSSGKFSSTATAVHRFDREKAAHPTTTKGVFGRRSQADAIAAPAAPRTSEATTVA